MYQHIHTSDNPHKCSRDLNVAASLVMRALRPHAVVFGDIGTSPIYTLTAIFKDTEGRLQEPRPEEVKGALSSVVWVRMQAQLLL